MVLLQSFFEGKQGVGGRREPELAGLVHVGVLQGTSMQSPLGPTKSKNLVLQVKTETAGISLARGEDGAPTDGIRETRHTLGKL